MGIARGGGENADLHFARVLRGLGWEVRFVVGRRWRTVDHPLDEFPTSYVRTPYLRGLYYRWSSHPRRAVRRAASLATRIDLELFERRALAAVRRIDGVAVHQVCGLPRLGAWLRRTTGRPSVVRWPGPPPAAWRRWAAHCSATFANGDALLEARRLLGPEVRAIPIGVDCERFRPRPRTGFWQRWGAPADAVVVLYVGRLIAIKGVAMLIDGFARAVTTQRALVLAVVGEGELLPGLRAQASRLGIAEHVLFTGALAGVELAEAYSEADLFAITSTYDNFPNAVLEAMSSGLPVVATRVGGIPLQVTDGLNGLLIEDGDVAALASALVDLSYDRRRRQIIGAANRARVVAEYDWLASGRALDALYRELLAQPVA